MREISPLSRYFATSSSMGREAAPPSEKIYSFFLKDLDEPVTGELQFRPGDCSAHTDQLYLHRPEFNHNPRQRGSGHTLCWEKTLKQGCLCNVSSSEAKVWG